MGRPPKYPELQDADWLRARYVTEGLSTIEIAEMLDFDCAPTTVGNWLRKHGIPARPPTGREWPERRRESTSSIRRDGTHGWDCQ